MENGQNFVQTSNFGLPPQKPRRKLFWIILVMVFVLVALGVVFWFLFREEEVEVEYKKDEIELVSDFEEEVEEEEEIIVEEPEVEEEINGFEEYRGSSFSTIVPSGWRVVEYLDGEGADMLFEDAQYSGITALRVFNGSREILTMEGVSGIGFIGCPQLARFSDYSPSYEKEQEDMNAEAMMEMEILDYTNTEYSAFRWFEKNFRRVDKVLFHDVVPNKLGEEYFEPQCEIMILPIDEFGYTDSYGYESNAYMYRINENATEDELMKLDDILGKMVK